MLAEICSVNNIPAWALDERMSKILIKRDIVEDMNRNGLTEFDNFKRTDAWSSTKRFLQVSNHKYSIIFCGIIR